MTKLFQTTLKKFPGYTFYSDGSIYSDKSSKYMKQSMSNGYKSVNLRNKNGKGIAIRTHILIAKAFVKNENPEKFTMVDHIDNDRTNNDHLNLQWIDGTGNAKKANISKNNNRSVKQYTLENEFVAIYSSIAEASRETGTSGHMIHKCCTFNCKNAEDGDGVRHIWKYKKEKIIYEIPKGKQIKNLDKYLILKSGEIYSTASNKYLKLSVNPDGYIRVSLTNDEGKKKNYMMHRLVMRAYNGKSKLQVNHIDNDRTNNKLENLEYVTGSENMIHCIKYGGGQKFKKPVYKIDKETLEKLQLYESIAEASRDTGIHAASIANASRKVIKSAGGFFWKHKKTKQN